MVKSQAKTMVFLLTASSPNAHVSPSRGRRTTALLIAVLYEIPTEHGISHSTHYEQHFSNTIFLFSLFVLNFAFILTMLNTVITKTTMLTCQRKINCFKTENWRCVFRKKMEKMKENICETERSK